MTDVICVLEARAIVKAWRMAQQKLGRQIGLRILTSEATDGWYCVPETV